MYKITIEKTVSGVFAVKVGCQTYFYQTKEAFMHELADYIADPEAAEDRMISAKRSTEVHPEPTADNVDAPDYHNPTTCVGQEKQIRQEEVAQRRPASSEIYPLWKEE